MPRGAYQGRRLQTETPQGRKPNGVRLYLQVLRDNATTTATTRKKSKYCGHRAQNYRESAKGYETKGNQEQRSSARRPPAARKGRASGPRFPKVLRGAIPRTPCTPASRAAAQIRYLPRLRGFLPRLRSMLYYYQPF